VGDGISPETTGISSDSDLYSSAASAHDRRLFVLANTVIMPRSPA
jgi:hypothetical protein